jgi:enoyl-[acyl-carrier protein] reductase I
MFLEGKKGIILGIGNNKSIAWGAAVAMKEQGASFGVNYLNDIMEKRVRPLAEEIGADFIEPCDLTCEDQVKAIFEKAKETYGTIDFVLHSVAFASKEALSGAIYDVTCDDFNQAMSISAWTLLQTCKYAKPILNPNGSIITMSYYGSQKAVPNYGLMGVAKAALEAEVRYLARELGEEGIRVNAVSAGAIRTLAASGIKDFRSFLNVYQEHASIHRELTIEDVGKTIAFMVSDLSSGVTGQTVYVDLGYSSNG